MPQRGGGGGDGCTEQDHSPATCHRVRQERAHSHAPPQPSPVIVPVAYEKKKLKKYQRRAASLPDDVLIEILSRVHYKSFCRFKCVSKLWLGLCSNLDIHNRSLQTVTGFFGYDAEAYSFYDLAGGRYPPLVDPTLPFLGSYERISIEQCCGSGLLLCKCWESCSEEDKYSYVMCNPVTEKWTVLSPIEFPDRVDGHHMMEDRLFDLRKSEIFLGFDALNPSSFVVVVPMTNGFEQVKEVAIYSSETGRWTSMQSQWRSKTMLGHCSEEAIFLNGMMHFISIWSSLVTVDTEGKVWREIEVPSGHGLGSIGQSQGYLHFWRVNSDYQLSIWVLEDYGSENWTIKHTFNVLKLFGKNYPADNEWCEMVAIHPDCNLIYLSGWDMTISYDMDNQKMQVICASKEFVCGVPYIPCFAKWSSDGH